MPDLEVDLLGDLGDEFQADDALVLGLVQRVLGAGIKIGEENSVKQKSLTG